jgi:hypothetical protein
MRDRLLTGLALLLTLALMMPTPAAAEFTAAEKAQEVHYRKAATHITTATWTYMSYVFNAYVQPTTKPALTTAALTTIKALDEINDGYSALVGDVSTDQTGTPRFLELESSRAQRLQVAFDKVARLKWILPQAIAEWNAAKPLLPDAAYQDGIRRVADGLGLALSEISAFDTRLPYLNPKPPTHPKFAATTIVGPHGHFRNGQWEDWRGRVYTIRAAIHLLTAVRVGPMPTFTYANSGRAFTNIGLIVQASLQESADTSGMWGSSPDAFAGTLETLRVQTSKYSGMPGSQHFWFFEINDYYMNQMGKSSAYDDEVKNAILIFADGWSHFNEGAWQRSIFPGCPPVCSVGR